MKRDQVFSYAVQLVVPVGFLIGWFISDASAPLSTPKDLSERETQLKESLKHINKPAEE